MTPKQLRFVEEYLVDANATQAALRAGFSPKNADSIGRQLLRKTPIAVAIQERQASRSEQLAITADHVLRELAYLGHSDIRHYQFDPETLQLVLAKNAPEYAMRAVSSMKVKIRYIPQKQGPPIEEREAEFRLWDKNSALTNLGKHLKLFTERHELSGPDGGPIEVTDPFSAVLVHLWDAGHDRLDHDHEPLAIEASVSEDPC